jgi:hypothetical protein
VSTFASAIFASRRAKSATAGFRLIGTVSVCASSLAAATATQGDANLVEATESDNDQTLPPVVVKGVRPLIDDKRARGLKTP